MQSNREKECRECGESLPLYRFYKHPQMGDGYLNKCKECVKERVSKHRSANIERIREYDRGRGSKRGGKYPAHIAEWRRKDPRRQTCHSKVSYAVRTGRLKKQPCEICGTNLRVVAHHENYDKPLQINWLCQAHHRQHHCTPGGILSRRNEATP